MLFLSGCCRSRLKATRRSKAKFCAPLRSRMRLSSPRHVLDDRVGPPLVAAVAVFLTHVATVPGAPEALVDGRDEAGQDVLVQPPLVLLDRQHVITAALDDPPGD